MMRPAPKVKEEDEGGGMRGKMARGEREDKGTQEEGEGKRGGGEGGGQRRRKSKGAVRARGLEAEADKRGRTAGEGAARARQMEAGSPTKAPADVSRPLAKRIPWRRAHSRLWYTVESWIFSLEGARYAYDRPMRGRRLVADVALTSRLDRRCCTSWPRPGGAR